jgi:DNA-binding HxlR family transcriptional regulator
MQSSNEAACVCATQPLLQILSRPWTAEILTVLSVNGPTRFGVLRRRVTGISARVLRERLRTLEDMKLVFRDYEPTIPPTVTYTLTHRMRDLDQALHGLERVMRRWNEQDVTS